MKNRLRPTLLLLGFLPLLIFGCGGKKMTDDDFVTVATTIYENIRAGWDHQPNETWESYYERRIGEACIQHGFEIKTWDKKLREVAKHPGKWQDKIDAEVLDQLLKWQTERVAAKGKG